VPAVRDCGVNPIARAPVSRHYRYVASRILIVDDSPRFRALAGELLAARGFEVLGEAADGEQALAAVAGGCPDGILLDVNLPGSDGFQVAAWLAAACAGARIVLTSADLDHVPAEVMRTCAAIAFVTKQELAVADLETLFSG
jgi:CheY-like chemotaxis protein